MKTKATITARDSTRVVKVTITSQSAPRQRLEAMAKPYGITLEFGSPSRDCIWVYPPEGLLDEHGEMPGDPYADGHTHYDYSEAKQAIEEYIQIVVDKRTEPARVVA